MKNVGAVAVDTIGNLPKTSQTLGFSAKGMVAIQTMLNNMYTNKSLAVFREYTANAHDSHVRAGVTEPVRVSLPTALQPTVEIEDFGVGLGPDEIVPVFGTYGESLSRESDDYVGGFGIGSKSAFTMGQQFIVTARKDGVETVAVFALDSNGAPTATIVSTQETEERNGVKISLAVEDVYEFHRVAQQSAQVWPKGTILLDGKEPESLYDSATHLTDDVFMVKSPNYTAKVYVIMGTVAYPVDSSILETVSRNLDHPVASQIEEWGDKDYDLYIKMSIGAADIAPSREALRDTHKTVKAVQEAISTLAETLVANVADPVTDAASEYEAVSTWYEMSTKYPGFVLPASDFSWGGQPLSSGVSVDLVNFALVDKTYRGATKIVKEFDGKKVEFAPVSAYNSLMPIGRFLVVVIGEEDDASKVKRFAKGFIQKTTYTNVFVTDQAKGNFGWFAWGQDEGHGLKTVDMAGWRAMLKEQRKAAREENGTDRGPAYQRDWTPDKWGRETLEDMVEEGVEAVFLTHYVTVPWRYRKAVMEVAHPISLLATQKEEIFVKRAEAAGLTVLSAEEVTKVFEAAAAEEAAKVTEQEREAASAARWLSNNWSLVNRIKNLRSLFEDENDEVSVEIKSPAFQSMVDTVELAQMDKTAIPDYRLGEVNNLPESVTQGSWDTVDVEDPTDVWPMLQHISTYFYSYDDAAKADFIAYINSK